MKNKWEKLGFTKKTSENFIIIMLIAIGGAVIYGLPYFRYDYYDAYLKVYHLTNTQMGIFGSIFGIFGMISYLFGGYLADKYSIKKLLTFSLIGTGIGGFIHLLPLNFTSLAILYAFWGFTSLFAFWPACVKAVRILSSTEDQGKAFGWFEGGRGIAAVIMAPLAIVAFHFGVNRLDDKLGMKYIIIFYSVITIISGILIFIKMNDENIGSSDKISFNEIGNVLKIPAIWIISIITFCNYTFTLSLYYFTPYATGILGMSITLGATLAAIKRVVCPISNVGGGYIADKVGTGNLLLVSFLAMAIGTIAILCLPLNSSSIILFVILFMTIYFFYNINYALTWAMMEEGGIPKQYSGTAVGIISTIGYLPEIFCSLLAGILIDDYKGAIGFRYYFTFLIIILFIGAGVVLLWKKHLKNKKISEERIENDKS